jgi:transposase
MERLEAKKINGHTYYYYSGWGWVNGKCRRQWQKYLGKLEDIAQACAGAGPAPRYAEVFQWGLPTALWNEMLTANVIGQTDELCPKRDQGLSTGQYLAIAAINRAMSPSSKRSLWQWFSQTALWRHLPQASSNALNSQRFWDHMNRIDAPKAAQIWTAIITAVVAREQLDLSSVSYDGTNFYTFIDTFNTRCDLARRGKNKQGRCNLRQVSYALFCCADGHLPLFYDLYEGNRNDAKQFPLMLERFNAFLQTLHAGRCAPEDPTVIFDKGNNSQDNFRLIDALGLSFVGSVKLDEHKELALIPNSDARFVSCESAGLEGTKAWRIKKTVYGKQRVLVVTYNQNLFEAQWLTLQADLAKALGELSALAQRLRDRAVGLIQGGQPPTLASVQKQCDQILSRQHLKRLIQIEIRSGPAVLPRVEYAVVPAAVAELAATYLGKNIIITNREQWADARIIEAYRSQFIIENVFKDMKDRTQGTWWPLNHWTDSKIRVHGLYCTLALLLRGLIWRRIQAAQVHVSMCRLLSELDDLRQVINIYPKKRRQKVARTQSVLTKTSELQEKLIAVLDLRKEGNGVLG